MLRRLLRELVEASPTHGLSIPELHQLEAVPELVEAFLVETQSVLLTTE